MRADLRPSRVSQLVLQSFGKRLHARLRDIIAGSAGRRREALLGAGVDDEARAPALDHAGRKNLRAVNHAPEIDAENALPVLQGAEHLAARLDAGVVQEHIGATEPFPHGVLQLGDVFEPADVDGLDHDVGSTGLRDPRQLTTRLPEAARIVIGDTNVHAESSKPHCGGKANTRGASGDDGNVVWRYGWLGHEKSPEGFVLKALFGRLGDGPAQRLDSANNHAGAARLPCKKRHGWVFVRRDLACSGRPRHYVLAKGRSGGTAATPYF